MTTPILSLQDLKVELPTRRGHLTPVDGVNLEIHAGQTVAVVGESGCGKSMTAMSILRLLPAWVRVSGQVNWQGKNLLALSEAEMRRIRGSEIAMIFQESMSSLNPVFTCGYQVSEAIRQYENVSRAEAAKRTVELFRLVGIPDPARRLSQFPHQLSGGLRQRIMIAMALSCRPKLLIADEPTTALDVTVQAQILDLLQRLKEELGMALLLITHDMGVVAEMAQQVAVMYAGQMVEESLVEAIFDHPRHPYTQGLLGCVPQLDQPRGVPLTPIPGEVPNLFKMPQGCRFATRCAHVMDKCHSEMPQLVQVGEGVARCWLHQPETADVVPGEVVR